jgi:superfamily II DNA/RNA helicase
VVHFDPPAEPKAYLHRSGRTARAGAAGTVVTLVLPEQAAEVARLHRRAEVTTASRPAPRRRRRRVGRGQVAR